MNLQSYAVGLRHGSAHARQYRTDRPPAGGWWEAFCFECSRDTRRELLGQGDFDWVAAGDASIEYIRGCEDGAAAEWAKMRSASDERSIAAAEGRGR